ncbi:MAG TPA: hypothetical protein VHU23_16415 [Rhizomicrobium sp.]|nr:hypothetical protein [Rhizomicrobium sp.]
MSDDILRSIKDELSNRFGGWTAYNRTPAEGIWQSAMGQENDQVIMVEVMVDDLDCKWWRLFRERLEKALGQEELVVRAEIIERL